MERFRVSINQTLIGVFILIGAIVITAVAFKYSGSIQLRFGADGIQIQIDGGSGS